MTSVIDHRHSSRLWSHWPNSIHFTQRCMFGAKTRNDDQNNLSSIKSIKWVIFCLYHLIYDIIHFSHLVQCKIKLNLQILLLTSSFIVFFSVRQKWLIPQIADMLYASLIYRRQIKSVMIFPAVRFSTLSKWLFFSMWTSSMLSHLKNFSASGNIFLDGIFQKGNWINTLTRHTMISHKYTTYHSQTQSKALFHHNAIDHALPGRHQDGTDDREERSPPPIETSCEGVFPLGGSQALRMIWL